MRISENPLCSRKSVTNFKESKDEEELKFVSLFKLKGNSKFKGAVSKFEEEAKQAAEDSNPFKKDVVNMFGGKFKIDPFKDSQKEEERKLGG